VESATPLTLAAGPARLTATGATRLGADGTMRHIRLEPGAELRLAATRLGGGLRLRRPARLRTRAPSDAMFGPEGPQRFDSRVALHDIALTLPDGMPADFYLPDVAFSWRDGVADVVAAQAAFHLPKLELAGAHLTIDAEGPPDGPIALDIRAPSVTHRTQAVIKGETRLTADVSRTAAGGWRVDGVLSKLDGRIETPFRAMLPADGGPARLAFESDPIRYEPGGLQPGGISALFEGLFRNAEGALALSGDLSFAAEGMAGDLAVRFESLSFAAGLARVRDLSGAVHFLPGRLPATAPNQRLTAGIALAGVPAADMDLTFALDERARLLIERLTVATLGGTLALEAATYDPTTDRFEGEVAVSDVRLADALAALELDGVGGSGMIDGRIPLRLTLSEGADGGGIVVTEGRLAAEGPGRLSIDNPALAQMLSGRNEAVSLVVEALRDFRYEELSAGLTIGEDGKGDLALHLLGHNPAVLDGQAFDLNVTIESDFGKLFRTVRDAFGVTDTLLERLAGRRAPAD
jgi:hypothetical protein